MTVIYIYLSTTLVRYSLVQNTGWPGTVCKEAWTLLSSSTSKSTVEKNHDADDDGQSCSAKMSVVLVSVMVTM